METEGILEELKQDFKRSINFLIFEQNILKIETPFQIEDIKQLRQEKIQEEIQSQNKSFFAQKQGLIEIKNVRDGFVMNKQGKHFVYLDTLNFNEMFKEFCFSSLFIKKESILALQEIRYCCHQLRNKSFFQLKGDKKVKRLDEFKTIQESSISSMIKFLKVNWINQLINIIKEHFKSVGKGWFNMNETNKLTYEFGKLKRFLTVVRLMMQDSLKELLQTSLREFFEFFKTSLPNRVEIMSDFQVENYYEENQNKLPLLQIDMIQVANKNEFNYLSKSEKIKADIVSLIEKVTEELQKIPDLEPKILDKLHKAKKNESYVLTPNLPKEKPQTPNPKAIPKRYPDENLWLWDLYQEFQSMFELPLNSIERYREVFSKHERILDIKPEDIIE